MNLPDHNFISAPLWLISVLHIVTFTLHLLAMNFVVGGVLIVLFAKFRGINDNPAIKETIKMFPTVMAFTVSFGVAPLLFLQLVYGQHVYSASIISGWFWLMIPAVAIICYYCLYAAAFNVMNSTKHLKTYLTIAFGCFIYISFTYSSIFSMT